MILSKKGFTLVELIIAVASLSLICALVLKIFVLSGELNDRAETKQQVVMTASNIIEVIKSADSIEELDKKDFFIKRTGPDNEEKLEYMLCLDEENRSVEISLEKDITVSSESGDYYIIRVEVYDLDEMLFELNGGKYFKNDK